MTCPGFIDIQTRAQILPGGSQTQPREKMSSVRMLALQRGRYLAIEDKVNSFQVSKDLVPTVKPPPLAV